MFSKRTNWNLQINRLTQLIEERKVQGLPIIDLTESNPTKCGFEYYRDDLLGVLTDKTNLEYNPNSKGCLEARRAISDYYKDIGIKVDPDNLFLTTSTSESYNLVFRLLMDIDDEILIPQPSYPLLDYLAQISDVRIRNYKLLYDDEWHIDFRSLHDGLSKNTKAILVINPNNPTGSYIKKEEYQSLIEIASENNLALVSDEVFSDYSFYDDERRVDSFAGESSILTFTLNGISKMLALPQMKLGWVIVSGTGKEIKNANARLEVLTDTFLSVSIPIQNSLASWFTKRDQFTKYIRKRIQANYKVLTSVAKEYPQFNVLKVEGGWSAVIKLPNFIQFHDLSEYLIKEYGVVVQPGYFYDFDKGNYIVISLIIPTETLKSAIYMILKTMKFTQ